MCGGGGGKTSNSTRVNARCFSVPLFSHPSPPPPSLLSLRFGIPRHGLQLGRRRTLLVHPWRREVVQTKRRLDKPAVVASTATTRHPRPRLGRRRVDAVCPATTTTTRPMVLRRFVVRLVRRVVGNLPQGKAHGRRGGLAWLRLVVHPAASTAPMVLSAAASAAEPHDVVRGGFAEKLLYALAAADGGSLQAPVLPLRVCLLHLLLQLQRDGLLRTRQAREGSAEAAAPRKAVLARRLLRRTATALVWGHSAAAAAASASTAGGRVDAAGSGGGLGVAVVAVVVAVMVAVHLQRTAAADGGGGGGVHGGGRLVLVVLGRRGISVGESAEG
eukprot:Rhum_TRINITY_DN9861_c0_g1::Rhum_TRINITY_DN9861_c0_g1_i1::g.35596::m.35596